MPRFKIPRRADRKTESVTIKITPDDKRVLEALRQRWFTSASHALRRALRLAYAREVKRGGA